MRILLVSRLHRDEIRGSLVATHSLARYLRDLGHQITLLHAAKKGHQRPVEGVNTIYTQNTHKSIYPFLFAARSLSQFDVIHTNDESGAYFALRSRLQNLPLVAQVQPPRVRNEPFRQLNWRWRYMWLAVKYAPKVLVPSKWLQDELIIQYQLDESKFHTIPYGIGEHWFDAYRESSQQSIKRIVLINMKGVEVALRAFAQAKKSGQVSLELFGTHKDQVQYEKLAGELGISQQVIFRGYVPNEQLPKEVAGADLLLHPARGESFGQVLGEAAALGIPAVSSRVNAIPEIVEDHKTGLLCEVDSVEAFSRALQQVLDNPAACRQMGKEARKRAILRWRWPEVVKRIESEVYTPIVERAKK